MTRLPVGRYGLLVCVLLPHVGCTVTAKHDSFESRLGNFLERRTFVINTMTRIKPPPPHASLTGLSQEQYEQQQRDGKHEEEDFVPRWCSRAQVAKEIKEAGYRCQRIWGPQFGLVLDEEMLAGLGPGEVADRIAAYYTQELADAGWYQPGFHYSGGGQEGMGWITQSWWDIGTCKKKQGYRCANYDYTSADLERGVLTVDISVTVDANSKLAHVQSFIFEHFHK